ncbi:hypothetical protein HA402_003240 [Bradysia odoriphaga]|nr:hypothetical protein HA402_003240 [Bradysia odoriphaga]
MVNKQYTIQGSKKVKNNSPPPNRNVSVISNAPNPSNLSSADSNENNCSQSVYEQNITYVHNDDFGVCDENCERLNHKDLSINDIGRFQYILQMDREMENNGNFLYHLPSSPSPSSSINSTNQAFWKAGSQIPITSSHTNRRRHHRLLKYLRLFWLYARWPIALLFACAFVAMVVYFLVVEKEISDNLTKNQLILSSITHHDNDDHIHTINFNQLDTTDPIDHSENIANSDERSTVSIAGILATVAKNGEMSDIEFEPSGEIVESSTSVVKPTKSDAYVPGHRNTQILEISTPKLTKEFERPETTDPDEDFTETKILLPTKETLEFFGFTSGHQNNFGVPIEEDERVLRMLNEQLIRREKNQNGTDSYMTTTDGYAYRTRVSPTLPVINSMDPTTERLAANSTDDGICQSTSFSMCRSVLHYDLTTITHHRNLTPIDRQHFEYLIESKCSPRAHEFICSILEPECRPERMGILPPCRRICKAILEPCAHIVAASEFLTMSFDCGIYPDSNDPSICRDATKEMDCLANEFQCVDKTCIPAQWRCDNIKDCSSAEDEENCKFCEDDEFRCYSNQKCIPDKWRCDEYDDCPDASDEADCFDDDPTLPPPLGNTRVYSFTQEQSPNPTSRPYLTISGENRFSLADDTNKDYPITIDDDQLTKEQYNATENGSQLTDENDDIQGAASGITVPLSKSLANFQDSKEIMMTSDSESDYKYSSTNNVPTNTAHVSPCPQGELRCINGRCITISQLCDKITDCPDGADEAMCVYKT